MKVLRLTPLATARLWFGRASSTLVASGQMAEQVESDPGASVDAGHITLEAFVPRGGRAEYGLLGVTFEPDHTAVLRVEVPYSESNGPPWLDSLGTQVDDVHLGLPYEYAAPILGAASQYAAHQFPPGRLRITEAAHGLVGSSAEFFLRLVVGVLTLLHDAERRDERQATILLRGLLVEHARHGRV